MSRRRSFASYGAPESGRGVSYPVTVEIEARQDSFPRTTQPATCQKHVQEVEAPGPSGGLESSRHLRASQSQLGAATSGAALAGQNRVVTTRQSLPILARLNCKYVSHHVPLDGPGTERYDLSGAVSLFTGRRRSLLRPSRTWIPFQGKSAHTGTTGTSQPGRARHLQ